MVEITSISEICVQIVGGVQVCVPDNIQLMTPYVLQEQHDWFEDEIKFLRRTFRRGQHMVDIGANYGVYTLSAASLVGPEGSIAAFEPFPATAGWLRRSIEANGFRNIRVIEAAVSSSTGHGSILASENSELNRLAGPADGPAGEPVILTTLDDSARDQDWPQIDFVKIDAEGHEISVIDGGHGFFTTQSPLVMCEIKAGDKVDLTPIARMEELGYSAYRLVPGLDALVTFHRGEFIDGYQLNLFCCKEDRARTLANAGHLVMQPPTQLPDLDRDAWISLLEKFPFGRQHLAIWREKTITHMVPGWDSYRHALNAYACSRSSEHALPVRYACLRFAYDRLSGLLERNANHPRLLSYVRVAADLGLRQYAVSALRRLVEMMRDGSPIFAGEPFLPVSPDLERMDTGTNLAGWIGASVLERLVCLGSFSSYFVPDETANLVPTINALGFPTEAMERRLSLVQRRRFGPGSG